MEREIDDPSIEEQKKDDAATEGSHIEAKSIKDYTKQFTTKEIFKGKDALIEWVHAQARMNKMVIVTKRSDLGGEDKKIKRPRLTLACERHGVYKPSKPKEKDGEVYNKNIHIKNKKKPLRITSTRKCGCPFLLKGVNVGDEDGWKLEVVCGMHNHPAYEYLEGHSFVGRLSKDENSMVVDMSTCLVKPRDILITLKNRDPNNVSTMRTIYNVRHRNKTNDLAGRTQMQQLLTKLTEHKYVEWHRRSGDIVRDLFWTHPTNIQLLRAFPSVLIMDCTYKTNRYRYPLLQIVGVTSTHMTFSVAFVYMDAEKEDNYKWALTRLKSLLDDNCLPGVIVTDRDLALVKSIGSIFPSARHLLCRWHISKGVLAKCRKMFETANKWEEFNDAWTCLVNSETENDYWRSLQGIQSKFSAYPKALNYIHETWLTPFKEKFVAAWTDTCMHLNTTTSNRAESAHASLKRKLGSSRLNFESSWAHIHSLLEMQHIDIKASFEKSRCYFQHSFRHPILRELIGFVSIKALSIIVCESKRLETNEVTILTCGCAIRRTHQLPCAHELAEYRDSGQPIPLDVIHPHWRKLDFINVPTDGDRPISPGKSQVERFSMWFEDQDDEKKRQLQKMLEEVMNPSSTSLLEPKDKLKTRGRPPKDHYSTRRLPSAFETVEATLACDHSKDLYSSVSNPRKKKLKEPSTKKAPKEPRHKKLKATPSENVETSITSMNHEPFVQHTNLAALGTNWDKILNKTYSSSTNMEPQKTTIYMDEFPQALRKYMVNQTEVFPDGNCGYRAVAEAMGFGHDQWRRVRKDLLDTLHSMHDLFVQILGRTRYEEIEIALDHFKDGTAPMHTWFTMPDMGSLIATCYNVVVIHLSMRQCITFLPYSLQSSTEVSNTNLREISVGFVGVDHYVQVNLIPGHPIPPISTMWHRFASNSIKYLCLSYQCRIDQFKQLLGLDDVATTEYIFSDDEDDFALM